MNANYFTANCRRSGARDSAAARIRGTKAFTLTELMLAVAIISILTMIGLPAYSEHAERAKVKQAIAEIMEINLLLERYRSDNQSYPSNLAAIGYAGKLDPWGQQYAYLNLQLAGNTGKARKNKKLHPLNSDYDLYSIGKDHDTALPLTAPQSRDDIVRANDGTFINLASKYDK